MNNRGFTLIELIVAIVILGIGVGAFITLINTSTVASIDPLARQQANAIARAYLEEILLQSFCDPDLGSDCPVDCDGSGGNTCSDTTNCTENTGGTETRPTFDDVCDYGNAPIMNAVVTDQLGNPLGLTDYRVTVNVIDDAGANLNGLLGNSNQVLKVDVTVNHINISDVNVTVSGYRANY